MNVALWAEIRRLAEIDKLSGWAIARRLHCSRHTVAAALKLQQPPAQTAAPRASLLDPYLEQIKQLLARYPDLSAVRIREEIARTGYTGSASVLRRYLRKVRPARGRVYQEVHYQPAQALQVDWGECGRVQVGSTMRKVSVFVAVHCYSRLLYIEFTLSQRKAEFYRGLVNALTFFGGSPRNLIFDNLKAAVLNGSGRSACFHPEFAALCGYFCVQPIACARRDPESKGVVEGSVRYVKHNALAGRTDQLTRFEDYLALAIYWRDQVANVRIHETTRERPIDRFDKERALLRPLPAIPFDSDEVVPAVVSPHARVAFDGNRYSARRSSYARPSACVPVVMNCVCCTKARWWHGTSAVTSVASCSCCPSITWPRSACHSTAAADADAGIRRLGTRGTRLSPGAEPSSAQEQRPCAPFAQPGQALRPRRGAGRHPPGPGVSDLRCRLCGESAAGPAPPPATAHADPAHTQTPRTDR